MTRYTYEQMLEAYNEVAFIASDEGKAAMARMIVEVVNDLALNEERVQREAAVLADIQGR
ncbi:MAG: hypothetical protein IJH04_02310 [Eggerthellaceae bacterium]|nr:hypothetical protein [Eggerthellaceae bacterium]